MTNPTPLIWVELECRRPGSEIFTYHSENLTCLGIIDRRQTRRFTNGELLPIAGRSDTRNGDVQVLLERGKVDDLARLLDEAQQ
jgi:hypothetical protein